MARYIARVRSPKPPEECFAYMADLSNFAAWDPGVTKVKQREGTGAGPDAVFDVSVRSIGPALTLRYRITEYDPPTSIVARAETRFLTSLDTITVEPNGQGSTVTYDAKLTLNCLLGLADPLLGLGFKRIGDQAIQGLLRALDGEQIHQSSS